jgi:hypothetical protein
VEQKPETLFQSEQKSEQAKLILGFLKELGGWDRLTEDEKDAFREAVRAAAPFSPEGSARIRELIIPLDLLDELKGSDQALYLGVLKRFGFATEEEIEKKINNKRG